MEDNTNTKYDCVITQAGLFLEECNVICIEKLCETNGRACVCVCVCMYVYVCVCVVQGGSGGGGVLRRHQLQQLLSEVDPTAAEKLTPEVEGALACVYLYIHVQLSVR